MIREFESHELYVPNSPDVKHHQLMQGGSELILKIDSSNPGTEHVTISFSLQHENPLATIKLVDEALEIIGAAAIERKKPRIKQVREGDIVHECGDFWVYRESDTCYKVMQNVGTHSETVQPFYDFPTVMTARSRAIRFCDQKAAQQFAAAFPGKLGGK